MAVGLEVVGCPDSCRIAHDLPIGFPIDALVFVTQAYQGIGNSSDQLLGGSAFVFKRLCEEIHGTARDFFHLPTPSHDDAGRRESKTARKPRNNIARPQKPFLFRRGQDEWNIAGVHVAGPFEGVNAARL